ncbi:hypothetical protein [Rhizobium leguminosarum]|uniref:hypothetical protein n=1 Tax=Rhizobium leguminosarum TaxID=384 RepID=UPI003F979B0F
MITHDQLLERYTWLSTKILGRWRRLGAIRVFGGKDGMRVYSKSDIDQAITDDMAASIAEPKKDERSAAMPPPARSGEMTEGDRIRERLFLERLTKRRRPRK